jgi:hypothetical protein
MAQSPSSVSAHYRRVHVAVQDTPSLQGPMEPHSERPYGATKSEPSVDSTPGEPVAIGGADLAPCSNETVPSTLPIVRPSTSCALTLRPGSSDEDTASDEEQLISIDFPPQYAAIKKESEVLAAISTVTNARTRLNREQLEADLTTMGPEAQDLVEKVLAGSNIDAPPTDVFERESGLRYWLISADGARRLFSEWIVFFQARPDYLAWAPFDVQDMMEGLHLAPAEVQQRALEVSFTLSTSDMRYGPPNEPPSVGDTESDHVPMNHARLDPRTEQPLGRSTGVYQRDWVQTRKRARWSQCRMNAWVKINGVQYNDLPEQAFEPSETELDSHCTPVAADIRLCNYPVSVEELLTVSLQALSP